MKEYNLECAIVRGGTTKGIFLDLRQLPESESLRDRILLSLLGSPDIRQINGLGGSDPLTSKVALICPSEHPQADVDYLSGEVDIDEASINYSTMCGNLASGVALFARATGIVNNIDNSHPIRIRNLNTGKFLSAQPHMLDGRPQYILARDVDGVQGYGIEIELSFHDPAGPITGKLLPSGNPVDTLSVDGKKYSTSIVDCGTLYAFFPADEFGLSGQESPDAIDSDSITRALLESLRDSVAGLISSRLNRTFTSKQIKIALVGKIPESERSAADLEARVVNRYKTHKAYPVTGVICLSAAALIPGSVVYNCMPTTTSGQTARIRISHPTGIIHAGSTLVDTDSLCIESSNINLSARILMRGQAEVVID